MVIVVIKWSIKPDMIQEFHGYWTQETRVQDRAGLVGEFLSEVGSKDDYPYITWTLDDQAADSGTTLSERRHLDGRGRLPGPDREVFQRRWPDQGLRDGAPDPDGADPQAVASRPCAAASP